VTRPTVDCVKGDEQRIPAFLSGRRLLRVHLIQGLARFAFRQRKLQSRGGIM
jgi:hypothetical protein